MSYRSKFDIDTSIMPQIFSTTFGNQEYSIGVNYNEMGDFYTIDLYDAQGNQLIMGEKLIYGKRLWEKSVDDRLPAIDLVALDESGYEKVCNKATFGKTVFLYIDTVVQEDE